MNRSGVPQIDNGNWLRISNELQEALSMAKLNGSEYAVIGLYMRLCYGWKNGKLTVKLPNLASLKVVGIKKQHARGVLEGLAEKNIIQYLKISADEVSFRFNKRYKTWKVDKSEEWGLYDELIKLNKPDGTMDEDIQGNQNVTDNGKQGDEVTKMLPDGNQNVTQGNQNVTPTPSKPAEILVSTDATDIKDSKDSSRSRSRQQNGRNVVLPNGMTKGLLLDLLEWKPGVITYRDPDDIGRLEYLATQPKERIEAGVAETKEKNIAASAILKWVFNIVDQWDFRHNGNGQGGSVVDVQKQKDNRQLALLKQEEAELMAKGPGWENHLAAVREGIRELEGE